MAKNKIENTRPQKFCEFVALGENAYQACLKAGYSEKYAKTFSHKLLEKYKNEIEKLKPKAQAVLEKKFNYSVEQSFKKLCEIQDLALETDDKGNYCNFIRYPVLEGRYAILHSSKGIRTDVIFDSSVFPLLSIWPLYGGCRGLECIMTEAFTSWPAVLSESIADGSASVLSPGEEFRTSVRYVVSDL